MDQKQQELVIEKSLVIGKKLEDELCLIVGAMTSTEYKDIHLPALIGASVICFVSYFLGRVLNTVDEKEEKKAYVTAFRKNILDLFDSTLTNIEKSRL
jgi:membrane protein DedA with SNARE-associated domain